MKKPDISGENHAARNQRAFETPRAVEHYRRDGVNEREEIAFSRIPPGSRLLDIGCGAGRTTRYFESRHLSVVAMDYSFGMVAAAKATAGASRYFTMDAVSLAFRPDSFDVVVFSANGIDYIHPYAKRIEAMREILRVIRPGGLFIFSSMSRFLPRRPRNIFPFARVIFRDRERSYVENRSEFGTVRRYATTPAGEKEALEQIGFKLEEIVTMRKFRWVRSLPLLGLLDVAPYFICRRPPR